MTDERTKAGYIETLLEIEKKVDKLALNYQGALVEVQKLLEAKQELLKALRFITEDVCERFDMESPSTNPGMKMAVRVSRAAIAKHGESK
jgi:hypothetical protein